MGGSQSLTRYFSFILTLYKLVWKVLNCSIVGKSNWFGKGRGTIIAVITRKYENHHKTKNSTHFNNAYLAYANALALAPVGSEAAATATFGMANTTSASDEVSLYNQSLDHYAQFMSSSQFTEILSQVCRDAGGLCLQFTHCTDRLADCRNWSVGE